MKAIVLLMLGLAGATRVAAAADAQVFGAAIAAYDAGKYAEAIAQFSSLLKDGESAKLHFNLGDSYYRNKQLGQAIFEFRKARDLSPRDPDIKYNLYYARKRVPDRIDERGLASWLARLPWTEKEGWQAIAFASVVFWGLMLAGLFKKDERLRYGTYAGAALLVTAFVATGAKRVSQAAFGVVTAAETEAYSGVGRDNVLLFKLHEGVEFSLGDSSGDWVQATLADGKKGWVRAKDVVI